MLSTILIFVGVLSLLVFVHEFGHFITAKRAGVRVEEFGFGFPPRLFGIKRGGTIYSINWIPLGGFVKIKGEAGEDKNDPDSFAGKRLWVRSAIIGAGVFMNFILAAVLLSVGYGVGVPQVLDDVPAGVRVRDREVQVVSVLPGSPAEKAGLEVGDTIAELNGEHPAGYLEVQDRIRGLVGTPVRLVVSREGKGMELVATPEVLAATGKPGIGVGLIETGIVSYPWYLSPVKGVETTVFFAKEVFVSFGNLIRNLIFERQADIDISGPVGIAVLTGQVARLGFIYLLQFTALLSVNLAIINIFPFPALDGGRILFLLIEKVRGRPIAAKVEGIIHQIGFALLLALVAVVTYRDLLRFGGTIGAGVRRLFGES